MKVSGSQKSPSGGGAATDEEGTLTRAPILEVARQKAEQLGGEGGEEGSRKLPGDRDGPKAGNEKDGKKLWAEKRD